MGCDHDHLQSLRYCYLKGLFKVSLCALLQCQLESSPVVDDDSAGLILCALDPRVPLYLFGVEEIVICVGNDSLANNSRFRFNGHFCASGPPECILSHPRPGQ